MLHKYFVCTLKLKSLIFRNILFHNLSCNIIHIKYLENGNRSVIIVITLSVTELKINWVIILFGQDVVNFISFILPILNEI